MTLGDELTMLNRSREGLGPHAAAAYRRMQADYAQKSVEAENMTEKTIWAVVADAAQKMAIRAETTED